MWFVEVTSVFSKENRYSYENKNNIFYFYEVRWFQFLIGIALYWELGYFLRKIAILMETMTIISVMDLSLGHSFNQRLMVVPI